MRTQPGWTSAAFVLDVFSRMVLGWQISIWTRTDIAADHLDMGLLARRRAGHDVAGLTHRSDRLNSPNIAIGLATPSASPRPRPSPRPGRSKNTATTARWPRSYPENKVNRAG